MKYTCVDGPLDGAEIESEPIRVGYFTNIIAPRPLGPQPADLRKHSFTASHRYIMREDGKLHYLDSENIYAID